MRRILWLILFLSLIAAIGIFMPFRVYSADSATHEITKLSGSVKQQLPKKRAKPSRVGENKKEYKNPQPPSFKLEQLPKLNPNIFWLYQPLHPIRYV